MPTYLSRRPSIPDNQTQAENRVCSDNRNDSFACGAENTPLVVDRMPDTVALILYQSAVEILIIFMPVNTA